MVSDDLKSSGTYLAFPSVFYEFPNSQPNFHLVDSLICRYASEPNIAKYIKIAASIREKTVRDVALRCRWMMVRFINIVETAAT